MSFLADRRVVIFGCGYVGTALADAALAAGARVTALTRNPAKAEQLAARGVDVVMGELNSSEWHARIDAGPDFVANTVSAADPTPEGYRRSYVDGMRSILDWASQGNRRPDSLIYTSSTGVYPQGGGVNVAETASTAEASVTGRILVEAENLLRDSAGVLGRWFVLRLAGIYGPGRHHLLNALQAGTTQFPGEPSFRMNLIHRDDVVGAMLACFASPNSRNEIFNLSDNAPGTRQEVLNWLATELNLAAPEVGGMSAPPSARKGGAQTPDRIIVSGKIRQVLGWSPLYVDFRAGYRMILAAEKG